jgi:hypothetical protein
VTARLPQLLDRDRLSGSVAVHRLLGPPFRAHLVDGFDDLIEAVEDTCHYWGGAVDVMARVRSRGRLPAVWQRLIDETRLDGINTRNKLGRDGGARLLARRLNSNDLGDFLLAVLAFSGKKRDDWRSVSAALPERNDPWYLAYLAALGAWPPEPKARLLDWARLRPDLQWSDIIDVRFEGVSRPGASDLLVRLRDTTVDSPAMATTRLVGVAAAAMHEGIWDGHSRIPYRRPNASLVGPNIVVLYSNESVDDFCLLWNLRSAHGLPPGLPLGVPATANVDSALALFERESAGRHFGIGGDRRWVLTSLSISMSELRKIANTRPERWRAIHPREILQPSHRAGRPSTAFATFTDGHARIDTWADQDADAVGRWPRQVLFLQSLVNVTLEDRRLPPSRTLAGHQLHDGYYYDGGWHLLARTPPNTRTVRWPAGWTVIEALARDRGLIATPSAAGEAAATFLRQLGSLGATTSLLLPALVAELHRLGERRGMSWFRERMRAIASELKETSEGHLLEIDHQLQALSLRPFEDEANELTIDNARHLVGGRQNATSWVDWALDSGVLLQGAQIECRRCGAKSWREVSELAPPIVCRGCGAEIKRPFPAGELKFRYRASEPLLRVIDHDALAHVLTLRWWADYFADHFHRPSYFHGAYPGVDFRKDTGDTVGEADVLLVFADGTVVPGECKRGPVGINESELAKLDRLADALGSPWTFVATMAPSRDCAPIWAQLASDVSARRPRLVLTGDHLFELHVTHGLGDDPFQWRRETTETRERHDQLWKEQLVFRLAHLSENRDPDSELFER